MSEEKQEDKKKGHKMYLVTIKTTYELKQNGFSIDRNATGKEVVDVEEREVPVDELENLGLEAKKFNDRQEYYAKDDSLTKQTTTGNLKFMYIASKDPRDQKPL